jgi:hypothetical protein
VHGAKAENGPTLIRVLEMTYINFISSAVNLHVKPFLKFNYKTVSNTATVFVIRALKLLSD